MVHRSAPLRLTGAFGVMLLVGGAAAALRWAIAGDPWLVPAACLAAFALGSWILARRHRLTYRQVGWIAVACTPIVAAAIATRDDPFGGGYAFVWGAPFAYVAGRRIGYVQTATVGLCLAAAYGIQALRVDDPVAFHSYAGWWLTATVSVAIVGGVTRVIWCSLETAQRQVDLAFEQGVLGMAFLDLAGRWQQVNGALAEILGRTPEELTGTPVAEVTHPDDRTVTLDQLADAGATGAVVFDKRYVRPDGSVRWVTVHAAVLRDDRGAPTGIFGEFEDITAQREAEVRLRASEHRFERMFHDAGVGMLLVATDGTVQQANRAAADILGTAPGGLVGTDIRAWRHPDDVTAGEAAAAAIDAGVRDVYHRDGRYVRADGEELHLAVTVAVVRDAAGEVEDVMVQLADVSDRDAAQRREAALAELGRLALAAPSPSDLLPGTVRVVAETLGVRFATVVDAGSREVLAATGWDGEAAVGHALAALDMTEPLVFRDPAIELRFPTSALAAAGAVAGAAVVVSGAGDAD
ncbi:MAG TPA: PAS domain S-box protein, partial [Baekduia sp.]|nr:PAS domain S-box protein [Baekduia sp.]